MESTGLVVVVLAVLVGYVYAVAKRSSSDHKKAKAGVRMLSAKRWSDIATAVPFVILLLLILRVFVEDM